MSPRPTSLSWSTAAWRAPATRSSRSTIHDGIGYAKFGQRIIDEGKISKAVKKLVFTESILFALNNVEQLGVPQRTFHPAGWRWWDAPPPAIVPPMKIRDFSFTALTSAI